MLQTSYWISKLLDGPSNWSDDHAQTQPTDATEAKVDIRDENIDKNWQKKIWEL